MKHLIKDQRFRHLQIRIYQGSEDNFDLIFTSNDYPYFRVQYKDIAKIDLEHLYSLYKFRAWILQWLPPKFAHWLFV
tara:strand:+ start:360 stop:590 length:231 start_codon:yes stop_codon:yes gene_type:complete